MVTVIVTTESPIPDRDGGKGGEKAESSPWPLAAGATIAVGIIIIIFLLFVWPMILSRRQKPEPNRVKREIKIDRRQMNLKERLYEGPTEQADLELSKEPLDDETSNPTEEDETEE
jgi:hypothetical protein